MTRTDRILVEKTLKGDRDAFRALVERYAMLVHAVIARFVTHGEDVEDISQEVFCEAYVELANLRRPPRFRSWLAQIATNMSTEWVRSQKRKQRLNVSREADVAFGTVALSYWRGAEGDLEDDEMRKLLQQSLNAIAPGPRRILLMHHVDGCSYDRIARLLGVPSSTVKMRLYRGRKALRREIEKEADKPGLAGKGRGSPRPDENQLRPAGRLA